MTDSPIDPGLARLREPFAPAQVGKLPRTTCRKCSTAPGRVCADHSKAKCQHCGNWMTTAHVDLDYVGHAQVTDRLLDADPGWSWEPVAWDTDGMPAIAIEQNGRRVLWIRLTVCGVTRLGVGIVNGDKPEVEKELIGDALRNSAMRFGVALDLWAKGDLHAEDSEPPAPSPRAAPDPPPVDWTGLGWDDADAYGAALGQNRQRARALAETDQDRLREWMRSEGWAQPFTRAQIDEWGDMIDVMAAPPADGDGRPVE